MFNPTDFKTLSGNDRGTILTASQPSTAIYNSEEYHEQLEKDC